MLSGKGFVEGRKRIGVATLQREQRLLDPTGDPESRVLIVTES